MSSNRRIAALSRHLTHPNGPLVLMRPGPVTGALYWGHSSNDPRRNEKTAPRDLDDFLTVNDVPCTTIASNLTQADSTDGASGEGTYWNEGTYWKNQNFMYSYRTDKIKIIYANTTYPEKPTAEPIAVTVIPNVFHVPDALESRMFGFDVVYGTNESPKTLNQMSDAEKMALEIEQFKLVQTYDAKEYDAMMKKVKKPEPKKKAKKSKKKGLLRSKL